MLLVLSSACTGSDGPDPEEGSASATNEDGRDEADPDEPDGDGLRFDGPSDGQMVGAEELEELTFTVTSTSDDGLDDLVVSLDGDEVTDQVEVDGMTLTYKPGSLPDGPRTVAVSNGQEDGSAADAVHRWDLEVDTEPPELELDTPEGPVGDGDPVPVTGTTEAGVEVAVDGTTTTTADDDGAFELELDAVDGESQELTVVATDAAGNRTEQATTVASVASRVELDEVRTVHATFWAWATPSLREPIEQMIDDGKINAVQLDLKDEGGQLGYPSEVELAQRIGADVGPLDLEETVADLHDRGVAVIGRVVAFADPTLAQWAWENGERDWVIQVPDGSDYYRGSYAGFTNYSHQDVIDYNIAIAQEAAAAGVDHILWDYIRRPEGMDNYTVPGLQTTPQDAIVAFTQEADERLAPYGIQHGASVYGIAADRPEQIGQDIPAMAEHLDYVAPMIYPSHWGVGEYGVADPNRQPYDIITATMEVWQEAVADRRARVVPWLEDTPYRAWDRPFQIREQIRAVQDQGVDEWLMWNPGSTFTPEAYEARG